MTYEEAMIAFTEKMWAEATDNLVERYDDDDEDEEDEEEDEYDDEFRRQEHYDKLIDEACGK